MKMRLFVLLNALLLLVYGFESRTEWMQKYFDKCDKLSGLYQELIETMETPNKLLLTENEETAEVDKHTAGSADRTADDRNNQDDITTEPVECNHHQIGVNSTRLENGMARLEHLMKIVHSGISDEKNARIKNTQSVFRIEANVEDKLDGLNDETVAITEQLTDLSDKIGNIVGLEANVQDDHNVLKDDTVAIRQYLTELSDKVEHILRFEANVKENVDVMMDEMARVSKRLTELSNNVFDLDTMIEQASVKREQNSLDTDILSDKLDRMHTAIMLRNNVNVALNKPATESSTGDNHAGAATDGNRDRNWVSSSCTHTQYETNPWWKVDLLGQYFISRVVIVNRLDCCGERLRDLTLTVSNTTDGVETVCGHFKGPSTNGAAETIWCVPGLIGQFLKIQINGLVGYLTLCEVEVY